MIYHNPGKVAALANELRGLKAVTSSAKPAAPEVKPAAGGKAHPRLWAAFTLSGPGTLAPADRGKP